MFKKGHRLHTSDFKEVFNFGKTIKTPFALIKIKSNNLTHPRFAVVVSKKNSKKAVERNYLKRKFMSALYVKRDMFSNSDHIFILNSGAKDIQYKDLLTYLSEINI